MNRTLACTLTLILAAIFGPLANLQGAEGIDLSAEAFTLKFTPEGRPESCRRNSDGAEFVAKNLGGEGFYAKRPDGTVVRMTQLSLLPENRLLACSDDGTKKVYFAITHGHRHIAFHIEKVEGIAIEQFETLHFQSLSNEQLRVLSLDYMTRADSRPYGVFVDWPWLWHRSPENPLGGFVLYEKTTDDDEDETLLNLWIEEKLPHPKVDGEWTLSRAKAWIADWQRRFADRTQMILAGQNFAELDEGLEFAARADIKQIYLFTDTWKPDKFWPNVGKNCEVNTNVFPRGEADLLAFAESVRNKGMYLGLHYISGGIGMRDPLYIAQKPDRRLASWGTGTIAENVNPTDTNLIFRPGLGVVLPSERLVAYPECCQWNWMRAGDEIIRIGTVEKRKDGSWLLKNCSRAVGSTIATSHPQGEEAAGLFAAYGQSFVPGNDTTLLGEIAQNYAQLLNRCLVEHVEFDGAEIHSHDGFWGYQKFATKVYEALDHPTSSHDSIGSRPASWFEYRLNSSQRLMQGSCYYTHGNYSVPVALASPSRPASTLLDAHFFLSQGNYGGALGIAKPEPMFGVTPEMLKTHGLTDSFLDALTTWKQVCTLLTPEQRTQLNSTFARPKGEWHLLFNHHLQSPVVPVARKVQDASNGQAHYEIVPTRVLTRKTGDIPWQNGQEHGPISPRQFIQPSELLSLVNPDDERPLQFILHVLPAFDFSTDAVAPNAEQSAAPVVKTATDVFTEGNGAALGASAAQTTLATNVLLQPANAKVIRADGITTVTVEGDSLLLTARNPSDKVLRETSRLPAWSVEADLTARRGLGMWVTGDNSGVILLIIVGSRDYIVPINFEGRRYIEIPNGEVSWARDDWGWRMETKSNDYSRVRQVKLGFGQLPPHATASVKIERLTALGELPTALQNPVVHVGNGQLQIHGSIPSGHFLQYNGGNTATVYDENWHKQNELTIEPVNATASAGSIQVSLTMEQPKPWPWLDVQFLISGTPMPVGDSNQIEETIK